MPEADSNDANYFFAEKMMNALHWLNDHIFSCLQPARHLGLSLDSWLISHQHLKKASTIWCVMIDAK
jgi:hypothetical protein